MRRHQTAISAVQWTMVALYLSLMLVPLFLPDPGKDARLLDDFGMLSRFLLWGIGWPLIMLSMMLFGRVWCGVFCPDGALTEFVSRRGRNRSIPRWMRWSGWPFVMLAGTTLYGQLIGVYGFAPATLLLLGLPTLGACLTGYLYGRGRRIWCMYLCPANGVFALLARISPLHFRVDREVWQRRPGPPPRVDCAPLINIRQMKSASACHACGRCGGYMDAVDLAARSPAHEILTAGDKDVTKAETFTLIFGLIGVCTAALLWKDSAAFAQLQAQLAGWLPGIDALQAGAPWWLLANYPEAGTVYSIFDGLCILIFVMGIGGLLGLSAFAALWLSVRLAGDGALPLRRLSLALVPAAGTGTVLGLSELTVAMLRSEGLALNWAPPTQAVLLAAGSLFSIWIGARLLLPSSRPLQRRLAALAAYALPVVLLHQIWAMRLFG